MQVRADGSSRMNRSPLRTVRFRRIDGAPAPLSEWTWDCRQVWQGAENPGGAAIRSPAPLPHHRRRRHGSARTPREKSAAGEFTGPYLQIGGAPVASEAVCAATVSRSSIHLANASTSEGDKP